MKLNSISTEKTRFFIIGCINTAIDFSILFTLTFLGLDKIISNYASTSIALVFSFFANKSFTFQNKNSDLKKQAAIFLIVTLVGLWALQPFIIWIVTSSLAQILPNETLRLFVAKILATAASLVWNYFFYSRLVFKSRQTTNSSER